MPGGNGGMMGGGTGGSAAGMGGGMAGRGGTGGTTPDAGRTSDTGTPPGSGGMPAPGGSYFPLAIGNKWTYRVTEYTSPTVMLPPFTKTQEVVRMEAVGGTGPFATTMALRMETTKASGMSNITPDKTVSWQAAMGSKVIRYRETSFAAGTTNVDVEDHWNPARLRLDEMPTGKALANGLTWLEKYTEYKIEHLRTPKRMSECMHEATWTVLAANEAVTVQGKSYMTVKIEKKGGPASTKCGSTIQPPSPAKHYWFARGIGKVKEAPLQIGFDGGQIEELMTYTVK
jgi:hypothetical protein